MKDWRQRNFQTFGKSNNSSGRLTLAFSHFNNTFNLELSVIQNPRGTKSPKSDFSASSWLLLKWRHLLAESGTARKTSNNQKPHRNKTQGKRSTFSRNSVIFSQFCLNGPIRPTGSGSERCGSSGVNPTGNGLWFDWNRLMCLCFVFWCDAAQQEAQMKWQQRLTWWERTVPLMERSRCCQHFRSKAPKTSGRQRGTFLLV